MQRKKIKTEQKYRLHYFPRLCIFFKYPSQSIRELLLRNCSIIQLNLKLKKKDSDDETNQ